MENPLQKIPKNKRIYVVMGGVAVLYVGYRWWSAGMEPEETAAAGAVPYDEGYLTQASPGDFGYSEGTTAGQNATGDEGGMPALRTNAEWTQYAAEQLSYAGYDYVTVLNALGNFLARETLTSAESQIVRAALAVAGKPPSGNYNVTPGTDAPAPSALSAPTNVRSRKAATQNTVYLEWDRVTGAAGYRVYRGGVSQNVGHSVDTVADVGGLSPSTSYSFTVRALDSAGKTGPSSAAVSVRTAAATSSAPKPGTTAPKPSTGSTSKIPPHHSVKAKRGDTISGIAARYGKSWQTVWNFNLKYRSKATQAVFRSRGPNKIYAGTTIWVPK